MFRKLAIAVITAWAALLETVADAIAATLPPPAAASPRLRVVATGRLCLRLLIVSPPPRLAANAGPGPSPSPLRTFATAGHPPAGLALELTGQARTAALPPGDRRPSGRDDERGHRRSGD
jgi:hypothetical protein